MYQQFTGKEAYEWGKNVGCYSISHVLGSKCWSETSTYKMYCIIITVGTMTTVTYHKRWALCSDVNCADIHVCESHNRIPHKHNCSATCHCNCAVINQSWVEYIPIQLLSSSLVSYLVVVAMSTPNWLAEEWVAIGKYTALHGQQAAVAKQYPL